MSWITGGDLAASSSVPYTGGSPVATGSVDVTNREPMVRGTADGLRSNWWNPPASTASAVPQSNVGQDGGFFGLASRLMGQMQAAVNGLMQAHSHRSVKRGGRAAPLQHPLRRRRRPPYR